MTNHNYLLYSLLCPCLLNDSDRQDMRELQIQYYRELKALASSGDYDTKPDFTVVLQPHMVNLGFPMDWSVSKIHI